MTLTCRVQFQVQHKRHRIKCHLITCVKSNFLIFYGFLRHVSILPTATTTNHWSVMSFVTCSKCQQDKQTRLYWIKSKLEATWCVEISMEWNLERERKEMHTAEWLSTRPCMSAGFGNNELYWQHEWKSKFSQNEQTVIVEQTIKQCPDDAALCWFE